MGEPESRRAFLRRTLLGAGAALMAACTRGLARVRPAQGLRPIPMGEAPERVDVSAFETTWPIKRVVYIIKKNRTFDHSRIFDPSRCKQRADVVEDLRHVRVATRGTRTTTKRSSTARIPWRASLLTSCAWRRAITAWSCALPIGA
jgi:hypothetical protein